MKRGIHFTLIFVVVLLIAGALGAVVLTSFAKEGREARRNASRAHLEAFAHAIQTYLDDTRNLKRLPDEPAALLKTQTWSPADFQSPTWPDGPGYMYVSGARSADRSDTIVIFENVPPQKRKLGRLALLIDSRIELLSETEFQNRLTAQQTVWNQTNRSWFTIPFEAP